jgi:hypothetical protein
VIKKEKLKTLKLLTLSFSLAVVLSACSLPGISGTPTQITYPIPVNPTATMTLKTILIQTQEANITSTLMVSASPVSTPSSMNTPSWSAYSYTCELAAGGGTMTMNLAWADRSNNEDGYRVYRDKQVIATLAPNSTSYIDVAFVATEGKLNYSIEAYNKDWQASGSTISTGCQ